MCEAPSGRVLFKYSHIKDTNASAPWERQSLPWVRLRGRQSFPQGSEGKYLARVSKNYQVQLSAMGCLQREAAHSQRSLPKTTEPLPMC